MKQCYVAEIKLLLLFIIMIIITNITIIIISLFKIDKDS